MIRLENICFKRDGKKILDNINLTIDSNVFVAITGPNGSGKSTLAKIIMGIETPDSGKIYYNEKDITNLGIDERAKIGIAFAFQQPIRFKGITVYDILKIAMGENLSKRDACHVLSKVGLCAESYLGRELNSSLSGGELKRIEIATVILRESELTIFDEPEAGIDLWSFNNLIEVFRKIRSDINGSTLIITHQERILNIADQIILLKNGKVDFYGMKDEIIGKLFDGDKCCKVKESSLYECCR